MRGGGGFVCCVTSTGPDAGAGSSRASTLAACLSLKHNDLVFFVNNHMHGCWGEGGGERKVGRGRDTAAP